jgi:hypothetical protein
VNPSWCRAPFGANDQIVVCVKTVTLMSLWGALSDERACLSFIVVMFLTRNVINRPRGEGVKREPDPAQGEGWQGRCNEATDGDA